MLARVVPVAGMVLARIVDQYERGLQQGRTNTIGTERVLAIALEQHVIGVQASLSILTSSEMIATDDLTAFHTRAKEVQINTRTSTIVLVGRDGQQMVNHAVPFGRPGPPTPCRKF